MKKILKYCLKLILLIIFIYIVLSYIKYPDKTSYIKPVAIELLNKTQALNSKEDKLLSKGKVIDMLQASGCNKVYEVTSSIVKTKVQGVTNHYNHWFSAMCMTKEGKALDLRITLHEQHIPDFAIYFEHSYCYSSMNKSINCGTRTITVIPSR